MISFIKNLIRRKKVKLKMIAAIDLQNGIGKNGDLIFSIKEDMQHFTEKTTGGVVIMGSTTYESIPKKFRPLKNRVNIVLNKKKNEYKVNSGVEGRDGALEYPGEEVIVVQDIPTSITKAKAYGKSIWIIGGASIYKQMLAFVDELEITQIFAEKDADTFFPKFKKDFQMVKHSKKFRVERGIKIQFQTWKRK